jgi:hypothetical protein
MSPPGVTYKTTWRIGQQIRILMAKADGFEKLKVHVELDETPVGGMNTGKGWARKLENKTIVMGLRGVFPLVVGIAALDNLCPRLSEQCEFGAKCRNAVHHGNQARRLAQKRKIAERRR